MVNAINTGQSIYTSGVQYTSGANDYTSIAQDNNDYYSNIGEITDSSIVTESIKEQQNEIFNIQISTQSGITLINTTKSAVDDMQSILSQMKEKINTLSVTSTEEEMALVQADLDELLDELYDVKNSAKYNGEMIFGEYDEKPYRLQDLDDTGQNDPYMEKAYYQIGYSNSENPVLEFSTVFSLGSFDVRISSINDIASAKAVTEAVEKDLLAYEKNLDTNKELLVQNNEAASANMEKLIDYKGEAHISDNLYATKILTEIQNTLISDIISDFFGFSSGKLTEIMTGIWGL